MTIRGRGKPWNNEASVSRLHIYDRRERAIVTAADAALWPVGLVRRATRSAPASPPARILCLRLERIGDLLMTLPALGELRRLAPGATIDLVVGSWNAQLASAISDGDNVETLDAAWLSRGQPGSSLPHLLRHARAWRRRRYDLALNFEPDVRTNLLLAASGAARLVGFASGGGGPLLDVASDHDPRVHTADNATRLVTAAFATSVAPAAMPPIAIPDAARSHAARLLGAARSGPVVAFHVNAGREVKQWPEARFRDLARALIETRDASIVFTGDAADRRQIDLAKSGLPERRIVDLCGAADLMTLAAVLERVDLLVTVDTGPMHLAHAVGTPIVAVFGPSDPVRYAPRGRFDRVVRIDLPCAPCNRIRLPPERCVGHTPDCLEGIDVGQVLTAVDDVLRATAGAARMARGSSG